MRNLLLATLLAGAAAIGLANTSEAAPRLGNAPLAAAPISTVTDGTATVQTVQYRPRRHYRHHRRNYRRHR